MVQRLLRIEGFGIGIEQFTNEGGATSPGGDHHHIWCLRACIFLRCRSSGGDSGKYPWRMLLRWHWNGPRHWVVGPRGNFVSFIKAETKVAQKYEGYQKPLFDMTAPCMSMIHLDHSQTKSSSKCIRCRIDPATQYSLYGIIVCVNRSYLRFLKQYVRTFFCSGQRALLILITPR